MRRNDLSIIVINYGGGANLSNCLNSFIDRIDAYSAIIVVDNASPPGSYDLSDTDRTKYTLLQLDANRGYGAACNAGARMANSDYLMFLNNDTIVDPDQLIHMVESAMEHSDVVSGCFGCILTAPDGTPVHSSGRFPSILNQLLIWKSNFSKGRDTTMELNTLLQERGKWLPVDYVTGAALVVSRAVFSLVGGFDERFFMYFEDTELQFRMKKMGFASNLYCDTGIIHLEGGGRRRNNQTRIETYKSLILYNQIILSEFHFLVFRFACMPLLAIQLCNPNFGFSENKKFVISTVRSVFGKALKK